MHYCMGEFVDWKFSNDKGQNCANCGMKEAESEGCCKHEQKFLKVDKAQKITAAYQVPLFTSVELSHTFFEVTPEYATSFIEAYPLIHTPPSRQDLPIFILNCVFRI